MGNWPYNELNSIRRRVAEAVDACDSLDSLRLVSELQGIAERLPDAMGEAVALALEDGRSQRQIAAVLGVSPSTLSRWLR